VESDAARKLAGKDNAYHPRRPHAPRSGHDADARRKQAGFPLPSLKVAHAPRSGKTETAQRSWNTRGPAPLPGRPTGLPTSDPARARTFPIYLGR